MAKHPQEHLEREQPACTSTLVFTIGNFVILALVIGSMQYFLDPYNLWDAGAVIFTLLIIPFRVIGLDVQWIFAAIGYHCNGMRAFKYAAVFR